jgi:hypothetical protein
MKTIEFLLFFYNSNFYYNTGYSSSNLYDLVLDIVQIVKLDNYLSKNLNLFKKLSETWRNDYYKLIKKRNKFGG